MMGTHFPKRAKLLDQGHGCGPGQEGESQDLIFEITGSYSNLLIANSKAP
jgi:hypothetical protein